MPELPEVEVVRRGLAPVLTGSRVTSLTVFDARTVRRQPGGVDEFAAELCSARIVSVSRRGKFLWLPLSFSDAAPHSALLVHLGMSGHMRINSASDLRHERVRLTVQGGSTGSTADDVVSFVDQRLFGYMVVDPLVDVEDGHVPALVKHIARDPLDPRFDDDRFAGLVSRRTSAIKRVLLDQTLVSGIGNIYADEALWRAQIHPETPANRLGETHIRAVLDAAREVMRHALDEGGTSFDTLYRNVNGASGYFERSLAVYGREGLPCLRCGAPIARLRFMNRSSHVCVRCQQLDGRVA